MKKNILIPMMVAVCALFSPPAAAQSLGDILGSLGDKAGGLGSTVSNMIEGVFTKSDLTVEEIAGNYSSTGPAVCFKSDNFLQKAGGIAAAATLESKLQPYFKKYGFNGMTLSIENEGKFTMKVKKVLLKGTITRNQDKTFEFRFEAFNKIKLGSVTAYIEKSGKNIDVMFDATKLKNLLSSISKAVNISMLGTVSKILDTYDGACVGCKFSFTSAAAGSASESSSSSNAENAASLLKDVLSKSKNKTTGTSK